MRLPALLFVTGLSLLTHLHVNALGESCTHSIARLKYGPASYEKIIKRGHKYEDADFNGRELLYWWSYTSNTKVSNYDRNLMYGNYAFQRLGDVYPDATMWGDNNPEWHDIMQGGAGTCYIESAMAAIAEFPDLVKDVFITKEKNDAGIYAFRFYIRGKPWIVTVDDYFLFTSDKDGNRVPVYSYLGKNNQFWAMLLEKAWAKLKGTYEHADGGFVENGLRALIGCPVISYRTKYQNADTVFNLMKQANSLNYVMGSGTFGSSDEVLNSCGIAYAHAYSVIEAFELMNADGVTVDHKLYMVRNPWGVSYFSKTWNSGDTASWTAAYRAQVPHGVDPLTSQSEGIFFVSHTDFLTCFDDFQIAHYRNNEGYTDDWYDLENDDGSLKNYDVAVPAQNGDLYFTVDGYYQGSIPSKCWGGDYPTVTLVLQKNGANIGQVAYYDAFHWPLQVLESSYSAGDSFRLSVQYDWLYGSKQYPARDYTVKVYSKQNLQIKDSAGKTNMWHMDGQYPSAFTKSHFRAPTTKYTPDFEPRSLTDVWLASNNVEQYYDLVQKHPETLFKWFNN